MLLFLPLAFAGLPNIDFGFPGIDITLFGETFKWNIIGYDAAHGGLPYFCAYMVAMVIGECINFPIQRTFVFRSKGNIWYQAFWYLIAFCIVTCIVKHVLQFKRIAEHAFCSIINIVLPLQRYYWRHIFLFILSGEKSGVIICKSDWFHTIT